MKYFKLGLIFAAILVFAACTATTSTNTTAGTNPTANTTAPVSNTNNAPPVDELASAKKIYSEKCVKCHKEDGLGGQVDLDGTKIKVTSYKSDKAMNHDDAKLTDYLVNGDDDMPAYGKKLSETEIKDLVKLIRRDFQGK
jgi:mono/diheme cytochrome c family protein